VKRVAIVGSRDYPDLEQVRWFVRKLAEKYPDALVVSGGARGVDRVAESEAHTQGLKVLSFRPVEGYPAGAEPWHYTSPPERPFKVVRIDPDGTTVDYDGPFDGFRDAAFARNTFIVKESEQVVAFTTGSAGTAGTLREAERLRRPAHIFRSQRQ
jgi:predicted Rossmann-fold nucleotide-binding protein